MGATTQDGLSNSAGVNEDGSDVTQDQPNETQDASQSTEQPSDQDSVPFSNIDRDSLSPEMQGMYDNMNAHFTQSNQDNAETRRQLDEERNYAAVGRLVEENPAVNELVWNEIYRARAGEAPLEGANVSHSPQPDGQPPEGMSPDEVAARKMIADVVQQVLATNMPQYLKPMETIHRTMQQTQAQTDYDLLCQKYPAAKTIRPNELQVVQMRYKRADGSAISVEEAYTMMAAKNPLLLTAVPNQPPSQTGGTKPTVPSTERGSEQGSDTQLFADTSTKSRFKQIKEMAQQLIKDGVGGLPNATDRARAKSIRRIPTL